MVKDKVILLGVTGGIAVYKAADLTSRLVKAGALVRVIMTQSATKFVQPLTFRELSRHKVVVDMFAEPDSYDMAHVSWAEETDLALVAPATANILAKMAVGLADDMLSTTLLGVRSPIVVAPAMNTHMWQNPQTQANMARLRERGVHVVEPESGRLACGSVGPGRLASPELILAKVEEVLGSERLLQGRTVLITAGPTQEPIDPVRYLSNRSSGKMGYALAQAAREAGAQVILVSGPTHLPTPVGVEKVPVQTALEMEAACQSRLAEADLIIGAAAVSDYRVDRPSTEKIKRDGGGFHLELVENPDLIRGLASSRREGQVFVAFAAETHDLTTHAQAKLVKKGVDLVVANDVTQPGSGFEADTNQIVLLEPGRAPESWPVLPKIEVARRLCRVLAQRLGSS